MSPSGYPQEKKSEMSQRGYIMKGIRMMMIDGQEE